jgi:hypothetical protein
MVWRNGEEYDGEWKDNLQVVDAQVSVKHGNKVDRTVLINVGKLIRT